MTERDDNEELAEGGEKGTRSPSISLEDALQSLALIRDRLGNSLASRESVAEALGYKGLSGSSGTRIGALTHFGLLDREGARYRTSELARSILVPRSESERRNAVAEAAKRPSLYARLVGKYAGDVLPTMLPNLLVREFGVSEKSSGDVAERFRRTMEYAGLLRNGIIYADLAPTEDDGAGTRAATGKRVSGAERREDTLEETQIVGSGVQRYSIPLDLMGRVATVSMPLPVARRDVLRLKAWVEQMLVMAEEASGEATPTTSVT